MSSYREQAFDDLQIAAEYHSPGTVRLLCGGCLADGEVATWPCYESEWAQKAIITLERRLTED